MRRSTGRRTTGRAVAIIGLLVLSLGGAGCAAAPPPAIESRRWLSSKSLINVVNRLRRIRVDRFRAGRGHGWD